MAKIWIQFGDRKFYGWFSELKTCKMSLLQEIEDRGNLEDKDKIEAWDGEKMISVPVTRRYPDDEAHDEKDIEHITAHLLDLQHLTEVQTAPSCCDGCGKHVDELTQRNDLPGVDSPSGYRARWLCDWCNKPR